MKFKQFLPVAKKLNKIYDPDFIVAKLEKLGFREIGQGARKNVYCRDDIDFVVKVIVGEDEGLIPKEIRPFWLKNLYRGENIHIQPKCQKISRKIKRKKIDTRLRRRFYQKYDCHAHNVMVYKGREVIIDCES